MKITKLPDELWKYDLREIFLNSTSDTSSAYSLQIELSTHEEYVVMVFELYGNAWLPRRDEFSNIPLEMCISDSNRIPANCEMYTLRRRGCGEKLFDALKLLSVERKPAMICTSLEGKLPR